MSKNRSRMSKSDQCSCVTNSHSLKKCKKLLDRKISRINDWQIDNHEETDRVSDIYAEHAYRQQALSLQNGQRLFTAMSDPSVCNYPPMPIPYAMEPVSLPPMYRVYPTVTPPNLHYRPARSACRRSSGRNHKVPVIEQDIFTNGCRSLRKNGPCPVVGGSPVCQQSDYTSLPPTANLECKNNKEELNSEHRRYSDPGLGPADTQDEKSDNESDEESRSSITTISESNKLVVTLIEQMTTLKESNSQLFKELHRTKEELQNVKSELNRLKQNASLGYQPGTLSEIIRELRDASRVREETMMSRVKSMLDDHGSMKMQEIEQLKAQLENMTRNKTDNDKRMSVLEEELATLKLNTSTMNQREIAAFEEETLALRRELQEARATRMVLEKQQSSIEKCVSEVVDDNLSRRESVILALNPNQTSTPVHSVTSNSKAPPHKITGLRRSLDFENEHLNHSGVEKVVKKLEENIRNSYERLIGIDEKKVKMIKPPRKSLERDEKKSAKVIGDIPDVAVVSGGSDQDPCSVSSSRTLPAPSRTTYTTAYI